MDFGELENHIEAWHMFPDCAIEDFNRRRINVKIPAGGDTIYALTIQEAIELTKSLMSAIGRYAERALWQTEGKQ